MHSPMRHIGRSQRIRDYSKHSFIYYRFQRTGLDHLPKLRVKVCFFRNLLNFLFSFLLLSEDVDGPNRRYKHIQVIQIIFDLLLYLVLLFFEIFRLRGVSLNLLIQQHLLLKVRKQFPVACGVLLTVRLLSHFEQVIQDTKLVASGSSVSSVCSFLIESLLCVSFIFYIFVKGVWKVLRELCFWLKLGMAPLHLRLVYSELRLPILNQRWLGGPLGLWLHVELDLLFWQA